jgi:hypothetical protein
MPIQVTSGDISQMVILRGYGVVPVGITGQDVILALVPLAKVVPVIDVIRRSVRKPQTPSVTSWQTRNLRRMLTSCLRIGV